MKLVKRLLLGTSVVLLALVVLVAGAVVVDGWQGAGRLEMVANARIPGGGGPDIRAYVARPSGPGPHPAVIMVHEFWGLNESIRAKADLLADAGYVVVAPDMFRGSSARWVPRAIYQVVRTPVDQINDDAGRVFDWLAAEPDVHPDRIAILGFCFGGRTALQYSLRQPRLAATAIFYGAVVTDTQKLQALPGPVLGIFGGADDTIPLDEVRAFEAGLAQVGVDHQISIYDGQPHAFVQSVAAIREGGPQGRAWAELLAFLERTLQAAPSGRRPVTPVAAADALGWDYLLALAWQHAGHAH